MAVDTLGFRLLLAARAAGADFRQTLTFGRQQFHPRPHLAHRALVASGVELRDPGLTAYRHVYADEFFAAMGADRVDSVDVSNYEGATILYDLNQPVPFFLHGRYSLVYDGGTSEHVFNYPQTLMTAMDLLAVGGHFVSITAGSNCSGHGFYQVSPELFFRVFSRANGFEIVAVLLVEAAHDGRFFCVTDPAQLRQRVEFRSGKRFLTAVIARKLAPTDGLMSVPIQSDYAEAWRTANEREEPRKLEREWRRLGRQFRSFFGRRFHLPWQSPGITALSDRELYALRPDPVDLRQPPEIDEQPVDSRRIFPTKIDALPRSTSGKTSPSPAPHLASP